MDPNFISFCRQHGLEPTDERHFFWLGGRHHEEPPIAYGCFGSNGQLIALLDAIPPGMRPKPIPLYRRPPGEQRPILPASVVEYVWANYNPDIVGFSNWLQRYAAGEV